MPTAAWVAAAGLLYGGLVIALGTVKLGELRALVRREGA